jgi:hypothetical protein
MLTELASLRKILIKDTRKNVIFQLKWSTYRKVPILVAELKEGPVFQLNDSSLIVSAISSFLLVRLK